MGSQVAAFFQLKRNFMPKIKARADFYFWSDKWAGAGWQKWDHRPIPASSLFNHIGYIAFIAKFVAPVAVEIIGALCYDIIASIPLGKKRFWNNSFKA